jgi:kinesin family protein 2/24
MDQFYLENVALFQKLVKGFRPTAEPPTEGVSNPDLVVGTRIRPLLKEDVDAGFPVAVFPRSIEAGLVDIHDLYNHPRGRPILKVWERATLPK